MKEQPQTHSRGGKAIGLWATPLLMFGAASAWRLGALELPLRRFASLAVWILSIAQNARIEDLFGLLWACLRCSAG